jgi:3-oxoacyl-[acyl-carrier protein] reductase
MASSSRPLRFSHAGNPGQSNYAASKAGLMPARELGRWNLPLIRFASGHRSALVETPILARISDQARQALTESIPLQRIGTPHEIRLALQFIIECDYFTGRVIEVDGGANF